MTKLATRKSTKGEQTMETENKFEAINYVKAKLLQMAAEGKNKVRLPKPNTDAFDMLMNLGAIEGYTVENKATNVDEEGKRFVVVTVEGLDLQATATSKRTGNKYFIFFMGQQ